MNKLKAVLIGGKTKEGPYYPLLEQGLDLSGQQKPNILLALTPKQTEIKFEKMREYLTRFYGEKLGLQVDLIHKFGQMPPLSEIDEKIEWSDVLHVCGDNTKRMMEIWETHELSERVRKAALLGRVVLSGVSAGAILAFKGGHSDSEKYEVSENEPWNYRFVNGLSLIRETVITPHYDSKDSSITNLAGGRAESFSHMIRSRLKTNPLEKYLGIDNSAALLVNDGLARAIRSRSQADVHIATATKNGRIKISALGNDILNIND